MEFNLINLLGNAIDNCYNNMSEDGTRKTVAKLSSDNIMTITYMTIINTSRENDLSLQMKSLQKETNDMINSRLRLIKSQFKKESKRSLDTKKVGVKDNLETLTVSPYSPNRTLRYDCTYTYEVK